ncbi:MAG: putative toxin-antitoxin system toxin component, PIN family [Propionibacteriaceae bacterium]|nr:putative toxin-antitoxin system toxin component, PIN family [Propionibacteriaceae bacterium]
MRRVLVDTNVIVSALLSPDGAAGRALLRVTANDELVLTPWIEDELRDVIDRKWPQRRGALDSYLRSLDYTLVRAEESGVVIRDPDDQPILDAAITNMVDIIVTGDMDFHTLALDLPKVMTPREFLDSDTENDG